MTHPSTSELPSPSVPESTLATQNKHKDAKKGEQLSHLPVITHPNFDPKRTPIDPARPMTDIPDPVATQQGQLKQLYRQLKQSYQGKRPTQFDNQHPNPATVSKWQLIESVALADHLALLTAAKLVQLPSSFYTNYSEQPLLSSLDEMRLLDMADIEQALQQYPQLTRQGISHDRRGGKTACAHNKDGQDVTAQRVVKTQKLHPPQTPRPSQQGSSDVQMPLADRMGYDADELLNTNYADDWEVILYPERFDGGVGSLVTDIVPCSVAVHALEQCDTRKTINNRYSAADICHYLRSYLLSQLRLNVTKRHLYRRIGLYAGHVIVAAHHLGWQIEVDELGDCYFNISSRCGLLSRYPNINDYHVNGW